jgi:hypothetical protein
MEKIRIVPYEPAQKVEAADALLRETIVHLARYYPPHVLEAVARESLEDLRPHLQEALVALVEIEGQRELSEEELSQQYAFKMLLATKR